MLRLLDTLLHSRATWDGNPNPLRRRTDRASPHIWPLPLQECVCDHATALLIRSRGCASKQGRCCRHSPLSRYWLAKVSRVTRLTLSTGWRSSREDEPRETVTTAGAPPLGCRRWPCSESLLTRTNSKSPSNMRRRLREVPQTVVFVPSARHASMVPAYMCVAKWRPPTSLQLEPSLALGQRRQSQSRCSGNVDPGLAHIASPWLRRSRRAVAGFIQRYRHYAPAWSIIHLPTQTSAN